MKEDIVRQICERLSHDVQGLSLQFWRSIDEVGVRYVVVDDLLAEALARRIRAQFPPDNEMRLMDSFRERKYTSKSFDKFDPPLADITFAIQDPRVMKVVEDITGIQKQSLDASLYAGDPSAKGPGHFLGPHIDNSHDASRRYYRTLNLLYYVTPDWSLDCGGNLELWDREVKRHTTIVSKFNRLVIMETNPWSWHLVSEINVDRLRYSASNYYFSRRSPTEQEYSNITAFSARPEQKPRQTFAWADDRLRQAECRVVPGGFVRKDVYKGPPQ